MIVIFITSRHFFFFLCYILKNVALLIFKRGKMELTSSYHVNIYMIKPQKDTLMKINIFKINGLKGYFTLKLIFDMFYLTSRASKM